MSSFAQNGKVRRADQFYQEQVYAKALPLYEKAYEKNRGNNELLRKMANTAFHADENELALRYYQRLVARKKDIPADWIAYATVLKKDGNYEESFNWLRKYSALANDSLGRNLEDQLIHIKQLYADSVKFSVTPLSVNTSQSELGPVIYGDSLIFSSAGLHSGARRKSYLDQKPYLKIFSAKILPDGELDEPEPFAPQVRTNFHDGPLAIAADGGKMFVTHNQKPRTIHMLSEQTVQLGIRQAVLQGGQWMPTMDFPFNSKKYSVAHPAVNASGTVLIFASNQPGGYGSTDLYISYFDKGAWSEPKNLGPEVNTKGSELFPCWLADGKLYFSSDGLEGLGGLDLFRADIVDSAVNHVENLGSPINSPADDFGMALLKDEDIGYFASNRKGGKGQDDLYYFERNNIPFPVRMIVSDDNSKEKIQLAEVVVMDSKGDTIAQSLTNIEGVVNFELLPGDGYTMAVSKRNYFNYRQDFVCKELDSKATESYEIALQFNPGTEGDGVHPLYMDMEDGEPIQILEVFSIHYDLSQWFIRTQNYDILNPIIDYLVENPDLEVRIESHADCRGSREFNNVLTNKRAKVVNNFFISRYIRPERIRFKGFGESRLLNICYDNVPCDEDEHAVNRRTIIKIVRKGRYYNMRLKRAAFYF
ncbi:OmpA family protein [Mangrovibacterium lignilyticum]|uniref:OmpA family protein n=1 Tax=Mangrovibacterium lignilyticum TaxID=2668052 RepID=UPI0013D6A874|nr:OmpA family protein [Mangrovibacterium lignilyticum]